jgi:hypothetical protein
MSIIKGRILINLILCRIPREEALIIQDNKIIKGNLNMYAGIYVLLSNLIYRMEVHSLNWAMINYQWGAIHNPSSSNIHSHNHSRNRTLKLNLVNILNKLKKMMNCNIQIINKNTTLIKTTNNKFKQIQI